MTQDKSKLHGDKAKANESKALREHPAFKRTMSKIREEIYDQWKNSAGPEKEQRENAYIMNRLLDRFEGILNEDVASGEYADYLLKEIEKSETET